VKSQTIDTLNCHVKVTSSYNVSLYEWPSDNTVFIIYLII